MAWVKLDDAFFVNPKVIDLPKDAKLLYLGGLTYAAAQLTDGVLTPGAVRMIAAMVDVERSHAGALVAAGLWDADGDNYVIHDYLNYNRTSEQVKADRDRNTQRQDRYRDRPSMEDNSVSNATSNSVSNATSNAVTNATSNSVSNATSNAVTNATSNAVTNSEVIVPRTHTPSRNPVPVKDPQPVTQKPRRAAARVVAVGPPWSIVAAFFDELGCDITDAPEKWRKEQCAHAEALIADGFDDQRIRRLGHYLVSQTWRDQAVTLKTAHGVAGDWIVKGEPELAKQRGSPNGKNTPDYSGIDAFSELMDRRKTG